jgi:ATP/maltotriose-dependent transcriptional regulator MalT
VVPDARDDLRQRLKATRDPEADADALGEMLARHVIHWPEHAWLVIDDYHHVAQSEIAEGLIERLSQIPELNLLVATRRRPGWVTPRKLIYGEVLEISRSSLAMTPDEALEVVGAERSSSIAGLLALAEGWPAVIGLAAHVDARNFGEGAQLPQNLYDFFAEELLQTTPKHFREGLYQLALLGTSSRHLAATLFPQSLIDAIGDVERLGFLSVDDLNVVMHPLLRTFFFGKLRQEEPESRQSAVHEALVRLFELQRWDDAFELIETFQAADQFAVLVEEGLYELLSNGRAPTVERWSRFARGHDLNGGLVDLLDAEILFRRGDWSESERLGKKAAECLGSESPLRSRALHRAGQSALFGDHLSGAIEHYEQARDAAVTPGDLSQALWGLFIAQSELELVDDALQTLSDFEARRTDSVEDELRLLESKLTRWMRVQGPVRPRDFAQRAERLLDRPIDPVVRCGFYQMLSVGFILGGDYGEALKVAHRELAEAQHNFLTFVLPHAFTNHALGYLGLRLFRNAESYIEETARAAIEQDDLHSQLNAATLRVRLLLATGRPRDAVAACEISFRRRPNPGVLADFLSTKGVALACAGESNAALEASAEAEAISRQIEARVQCAGARAIVALRTSADDRHEIIDALIREVELTGNVDGLIFAYRGFPPLLRALSSRGFARVHETVQLGRDHRLALKMGISRPGKDSASGLTRRERQVYELLKDGRTNREIAEALWISETTAKVHVHHILEKLGARSRTEAALKGQQ